MMISLTIMTFKMKNCCDDLNNKYINEKKEIVEEVGKVCYATETFGVPVMSATTNQKDQDTVRPASEPVILDLKDLCLSASAYMRNSNFNYCIQAINKNSTCGASQRKCKPQETYHTVF